MFAVETAGRSGGLHMDRRHKAPQAGTKKEIPAAMRPLAMREPTAVRISVLRLTAFIGAVGFVELPQGDGRKQNGPRNLKKP